MYRSVPVEILRRTFLTFSRNIFFFTTFQSKISAETDPKNVSTSVAKKRENGLTDQGCQIFLGTTYQNGEKIYQSTTK
jgi:hypothetical protein